MVNRFLVMLLCPLFFGTSFNLTHSDWRDEVDGSKIIIGHYQSPPNPIRPGVPVGDGSADGSRPAEFPPSTYTLADFCAGIPIPHNLGLGFGLGDLSQLIKNKESLCAQHASSSEKEFSLAQAVKDEASRIIDAGEINVDPADTTLLVNKPAYFLATARETLGSVVVSGEVVRIRLEPSSYDWDFGDGSTLTTSSAGGHWPDGDVQHSYTRQGSYRPSVTVRWNIFVQFPGSDWVRLFGNGKTTANGSELTVVNARSVLTLPF